MSAVAQKTSVTLVSPDGVKVSVPEAQVESLRASGYRKPAGRPAKPAPKSTD